MFGRGQAASHRERHGGAARESKLAAGHASVYGAELVAAHGAKGAVVEDLQRSGRKSVDVHTVDDPEVALLYIFILVNQLKQKAAQESVWTAELQVVLTALTFPDTVCHA